MNEIGPLVTDLLEKSRGLPEFWKRKNGVAWPPEVNALLERTIHALSHGTKEDLEEAERVIRRFDARNASPDLIRMLFRVILDSPVGPMR